MLEKKGEGEKAHGYPAAGGGTCGEQKCVRQKKGVHFVFLLQLAGVEQAPSWRRYKAVTAPVSDDMSSGFMTECRSASRVAYMTTLGSRVDAHQPWNM